MLIAFVRDNGLWVVRNDGRGERLLVSADDFKMMEPQQPGVMLSQFEWIRGTHQLLFNTRLLVTYGLSYTDDLYFVNADSAQWRQLRAPHSGGRFFISPDGRWVSMTAPSQISLMRTNGTQYHVALTYAGVAIPSEFAYYPHPIWTSDSKSVIVAIPPKDLYYQTQSLTTIWRFQPDGLAPKIVARVVPVPDVQIAPDFSRLAVQRFVRQEPPNFGPVFEIHIAKIDGSDDVIYSTGTTLFIAWAPESEHFILWDQQLHIYALGKVDTTPIPLTERSNVSGLFSWIDTSHFLYVGGQRGTCELRIGTIAQPSMLLTESKSECLQYDFIR